MTGDAGPSWRSIAASGHVGDERTARDGWSSSDHVRRELALGSLARLGVLTDDDLRVALADPAAGVRRRAAALAANHPCVALGPVLDDTDPGVVEVAAWSCGERARVDRPTLARLFELATNDDQLVREAAVAALGALGEHLDGDDAAAALEVVLRGAADKPAIRRRAVLALAAFDSPRVIDALRAAATDRDWQVRQAAEDVLRATGYSS